MSSTNHFSQVDDFTKQDILDVSSLANKFTEQEDNSAVASGKVLGLGFFQESTRTVAGLQTAIIQMGGGWLGVDSPAGSYADAGTESAEDTIKSLASVSDVMAIRHKDLNLPEFSKQLDTPVINAMCGGDEHSQGAVTTVHTLQKHLGKIDNISVGIYGMTSSSRPAKGIMRALSKFGATFYEDSVVGEFESSGGLKKEIEDNGGEVKQGSVEDFIGDVDFLLIVEGLPQKDADEAAVKKYNEKFQIFGKEQFEEIDEDSVFMYGMPAKLKDGRDIVNKEEADADERMLTYEMVADMAYVNMALIAKLLELDV